MNNEIGSLNGVMVSALDFAKSGLGTTPEVLSCDLERVRRLKFRLRLHGRSFAFRLHSTDIKNDIETRSF